LIGTIVFLAISGGLGWLFKSLRVPWDGLVAILVLVGIPSAVIALIVFWWLGREDPR
jgi:hypothetical protein